MGDEIELLKRRLQRERNIRQQAEKIAEEKSRELYLKGVELKNALQAEGQANGDSIRIISIRRATKYEEKTYFSEIPD